jgi:hypothetical protein
MTCEEEGMQKDWERFLDLYRNMCLSEGFYVDICKKCGRLELKKIEEEWSEDRVDHLISMLACSIL